MNIRCCLYLNNLGLLYDISEGPLNVDYSTIALETMKINEIVVYSSAACVH